MKILLALFSAVCFGCSQTGTAQKLQSHIASAQTSSAQTGQRIKSVRSRLDTIDYKGSRAQELLNKGVDQ